jgi:TolB-like protein/tetratricopeptide (TPR) repeat protein
VLPGRNLIVRDGAEKHLENRLMQTLVFLAEHRGQVVTREQFFDSVWRGRVVNEEALSRAISLLRTALGDDVRAPKYIQTIPGVGYRLIAEVDSVLHRGERAPSPGKAPANSIAVLPFVNMSDDPANEYFSDGISEEILNVLAQGESFKVAGRTSSFMFKGRHEDPREIGRTLGVAHVLEGSVRKANARVRITAQLLKADDGFHLWSKTFDRELEDVFLIQDEIATAVVEALKARLLSSVPEQLVIGGTENPEAFEAYLKGLHHRNRGSNKETLYGAREAFRRAAQLDPGYAKAWAGLAFTAGELIWNSFVEFAEGRRQMMDAASKAIELAPSLADGHLAMGMLWQLGMPRWQPALDALGTALRFSPGNAEVMVEWARVNCNLGRAELSVAAARKALELDPISVYVNHLQGHILYFCRRYEEAIPALRRTLQLDPGYPKPHYFMAMCHHWLGDSQTAWEVIQREPLAWMKYCASSVILHELGRTREAMDAFGKLVEMGAEETNDIQQADVHAQLGDADQAIESLQRALGHRDPGLAQLLVDPFLDPLRDDPRFREILAQAGFGAELLGSG